MKYPLSDSWSTVPAGYIASSANDMGKYLQMYLRGGYGILSDKSLSTMFRVTVPMDESGETGYGMGWVRSDKYVETVYNHTRSHGELYRRHVSASGERCGRCIPR